MFKPRQKSKLELEIDRLTLALRDHDPNSEEYGSIVERLSKLHKVAHDNAPTKLSKDVALTVGANLLGIGMIIRHEEFYALSSKALGFVIKTKT